MTRTTPEVKMAVSGPTDTAKDTAHASEFTTGDSLTTLKTLGPLLTKVYKSDGSTESYGDAASFRPGEKEVSDIVTLSAFLTELQDKPDMCVIHGKFVGKDKALAGSKAGTYARTNQNFSDQPQKAFLIDVDKYKPSFGDPVHEPEICIQEYIRKVLPLEFQNVSFHWQLSSSAGQPSNLDVLKCHVWFWLETPRKCSELYEWAKAIGPQVDKVVYRRVQVRYTANPIFEEGRIDPVPVRSGLCRGLRDTLPLVIGEAMLAQARDQGTGEGGNDKKLVDPAEKDGLLGLFHKTFSAEQVLLQLLEGEFEQVSQRRFTWVNGGGTPEGVWVHDDDMHVGASHNTWPIDGIANLWDLVREFKFGHLDAVETEDAFERENAESIQCGHRPSDRAMREYAAGLDEIKAAILEEAEQEAKERKLVVDRLIAEINAAPDAHTLENILAPNIKKADLSPAERATVVKAMQDQLKKAGSPMTKSEVAKMLAPPRVKTTVDSAPDWAKQYCWVRSLDRFVDTKTKEEVTVISYNASYGRYMGKFVDENGNVPRASDMATDVWHTRVVTGIENNPAAALFFKRDGLEMLNTYRPDLLPELPDKYSQADLDAIAAVECHAELLIPDVQVRTIFLDYLAYCVQHPGAKIRWAPLIYGMEGDGKTAFITLMGQVMGSRNIRVLTTDSLEESFTGWGTGQCFVGVEEVQIHGDKKYRIYNRLKPFISNDVVDVLGKSKDPVTLPNTSNFLLLTNHQDAVPVSSNDRRILFINSPFRDVGSLQRGIKRQTGLSPVEYFERLSDHSIKARPGALRKWFLERELSSEFNPNGRAFETEAREAAINLARRDEDIAVEGVIGLGGLGIYENLVAGKFLTEAIFHQCRQDVRTSKLSNALARLGWTSIPKQIKWRGWPHSWYYKDIAPDLLEKIEKSPSELAAYANGLEELRKSTAIEGDFQD